MPSSRTRWIAAVILSSLATTAARAEDVAAAVAAKLRDSGALQGYRVNVKAKSGTVWLEGSVADQKQLAAAIGIAESSPGVERVVNRLTIAAQTPAPMAAAAARDATETSAAVEPKPAIAKPSGIFALFAAGPGSQAQRDDVQLAQAVAPARGGRPPQPLPRAAQQPRPIQSRAMGRPAGQRTAMRTSGMGEPLSLPSPGGYDVPSGQGMVGDGQIVPGSVRYGAGGAEGVPMDAGDGYAAGGPAAGGGYAGGYAGGGPVPMGGTGMGMPPVPGRADGPNMPGYAWPSYSASPNYAALQYPTQYSPTAWPYIGPFYPYPQVPLGWRRASLEWDDGWWWLDFDERHIHSHHR
jgi:hypothetical protein